jgi:O-antigen biosynthesis protein WbqV
MRGVRVIDTLENLETALINLGRKGIEVDCLILARNGKVHGEAFDKLAGIAQSRGISLVRIPEVRDLIGQPSADRLALEPVDLEDLLPRREITLKNDVLNGVFDGSAVLVTGAGGSLGSELCQQVLRLKPRRLVLFDNSEYLLNQIETTLRTTAGEVEIIPLIGNVRDRAEVFAVFEGHAPEYVFHCAALKHVPIVERQPIEGVKTNVAGTLNVADAALAVGAKAMVLISTDKAVRPTSLMGATKRIAEMYCQSLDFVGKTRFVTVRFGNVLGSAGSVVPLFSQQIASGGPVTVTHPDIERYFMSIPEAVHLVLHATGYGISTEEGDRGRIFVLDMGAPVKIVDIARKLIWLKGLRPNKDIAIEFVGLRPGEKMFEELFQGTEQLVATGVDGVLAAEPRHQFDRSTLVRLVNSIRTAAEEGDLPRVKRALLDLVPDYAAMPERFVVSSPATREKLRVVHGELGA